MPTPKVNEITAADVQGVLDKRAGEMDMRAADKAIDRFRTQT